jgi:plastocyanin
VFSFVLMVFVTFAIVGCSKQGTSEPSELATKGSGPAIAVDPATAGSVTGNVILDGPPPVLRPIDMGGQPFCGKAHPSPVPPPAVVTGENGALANVVVFVKSGLGNYRFDIPRKPVVLDQQGCMYEPHVAALIAGQTLEVTNSDETLHNVHPMPRDNPEWNKSQPAGSPPISAIFSQPELAIPMMCNVHPWMKSYIFVFKNPYFVVTSKTGTFNIGNLPPGTYTIEAWQERFGTLDETVTIRPKDSKVISFRFRATSVPGA